MNVVIIDSSRWVRGFMITYIVKITYIVNITALYRVTKVRIQIKYTCQYHCTVQLVTGRCDASDR